MSQSKRVAIFHDWLVTWRGGEKCLEQILEIYPEAEIYTLFIADEIKKSYLPGSRISTGLLGKLPFVSKYYRLLLIFFPLDILYLSLKLRVHHRRSPYDLVISISHCAVKNVKVPESLLHVCYCLTPMRYIWDQYDRYLSGVWYEPIFRPIRRILQLWDVSQSKNVTKFIAISEFISQRIEKCYKRNSLVVYPPVYIKENTDTKETASKYTFLMVNALVPYKNTKLIVESFRDLPYSLRIVGSGPEESRLRKISSSNTVFLGRITDDDLYKEYQNCSALIYAAEEDFGIVPVEAQAHGTPVICYSRGGCLETVVLNGEKRTGVSFDQLTHDAVKQAVVTFTELCDQFVFNAERCIANAQKFSESEFRDNFKKAIDLISGTVEDAKKARATF
jgi:glycosyltransferase involved in cell wall biosynthesis